MMEAVVVGMEEDTKEELRAIREQLQIDPDTEEEPGDWVVHQAEVDTLLDRLQVPKTAARIWLGHSNMVLYFITAKTSICRLEGYSAPTCRRTPAPAPAGVHLWSEAANLLEVPQVEEGDAGGPARGEHRGRDDPGAGGRLEPLHQGDQEDGHVYEPADHVLSVAHLL